MTHHEISVRTACLEDIDELNRLWEELDAFHRIARPDLYKKPQTLGRPLEEIRALIGGPDSTLLVAETDEGSLSGLASLVIQEREATPIVRPRRFAQIDNFVVDGLVRREGIGKRLMIAAMDWAEIRQVDALSLSALAFNKEAIAFYQDFGFETETVRLSFKMKERSHDH